MCKSFSTILHAISSHFMTETPCWTQFILEYFNWCFSTLVLLLTLQIQLLYVKCLLTLTTSKCNRCTEYNVVIYFQKALAAAISLGHRIID